MLSVFSRRKFILLIWFFSLWLWGLYELFFNKDKFCVSLVFLFLENILTIIFYPPFLWVKKYIINVISFLKNIFNNIKSISAGLSLVGSHWVPMRYSNHKMLDWNRERRGSWVIMAEIVHCRLLPQLQAWPQRLGGKVARLRRADDRAGPPLLRGHLLVPHHGPQHCGQEQAELHSHNDDARRHTRRHLEGQHSDW